MVDLGDLSGEPLDRLVCPADLLGSIDLYLLPHHGGRDVSYPATFSALRPRVAILNNGAIKGGDTATLEALHRVPGLEDVWQLHRRTEPGAPNFAAERIANLDESTGHWIKVAAMKDGSFAVTNGRTGDTRQYAPRHR